MTQYNIYSYKEVTADRGFNYYRRFFIDGSKSDKVKCFQVASTPSIVSFLTIEMSFSDVEKHRRSSKRITESEFDKSIMEARKRVSCMMVDSVVRG